MVGAPVARSGPHRCERSTRLPKCRRGVGSMEVAIRSQDYTERLYYASSYGKLAKDIGALVRDVIGLAKVRAPWVDMEGSPEQRGGMSRIDRI